MCNIQQYILLIYSKTLTLDTVKYIWPDCIDIKHWLSWPTLSRWCWFRSVSSALELHSQIIEILSKIYRRGAQAGFSQHRISGPVCAKLLRTRGLTQDHSWGHITMWTSMEILSGKMVEQFHKVMPHCTLLVGFSVFFTEQYFILSDHITLISSQSCTGMLPKFISEVVHVLHSWTLKMCREKSTMP